jgi:hypothetical protein
MGLHCSFKHLKHKLWPKERSEIKLIVWLPTRKSQESTRFTWLQTTCDISLESSRWVLQLCLRLHFEFEVDSQSYGAPKSWESPLAQFRDSHSGVPREKSHLDVGSMASHRVYYKGDGGGFPQVRVVVSLVCSCCPGFVLAPRVL